MFSSCRYLILLGIHMFILILSVILANWHNINIGLPSFLLMLRKSRSLKRNIVCDQLWRLSSSPFLISEWYFAYRLFLYFALTWNGKGFLNIFLTIWKTWRSLLNFEFSSLLWRELDLLHRQELTLLFQGVLVLFFILSYTVRHLLFLFLWLLAILLVNHYAIVSWSSLRRLCSIFFW